LVTMKNMDNRVRVKVSIGDVSVEIEAPVGSIEEAVRRVVLGIEQARSARGPEGGRAERRGVTCLDLVERLVSEGWFDSPRSLSEVIAELGKRGYSYDSTAVAHSLLDLVRREVLGREGKPKRYLYFARRKGGAVAEEGAEGAQARSLDVET
jgi:hypothetical protein